MEALDAKDAAADAGASTGPPTPSAIGALVIFLVSVACVIALVLLPVKLRVPVPRRLRAARNGGGSSSGGVRASVAVRIPHWLPPPLGVLVMLAAGCLDSRGLLNGILGDSSIQPYSILILFLALAYIAAALDQTGAFAWLALKMTGRAATTGPRLFALQSLLAAVVTLFTSNDVVVMSLTPIVYVQTVASGAEPMPFLAAEFVASNIWSMALYIGNPTNIIVAQAFSLSFLDYSRWMLAPTAAAGLAGTVVLYMTHRRALPTRLALPNIPPASVLSDPWGAVFGAVNLAVCLALLAAAPSLGFHLWVITLVCAGASCAYGLCAYVLAPLWLLRLRRPPQGRASGRSAVELLPRSGHGEATPSSSRFFDAGGSASGGGGSSDEADKEGAAGGSGMGSEVLVWAGAELSAEAANGAHKQLASSANGAAVAVDAAATGDAAAWRLQERPGVAPLGLDHAPGAPDAAPLRPGDLDTAAAAAAAASAGAGTAGEPPSATVMAASSLRAQLAAKRPTFWGPFWSVPWDVVPLVLGFFILVEGLSANGWVDRLGAALGGSARSLAAGLWCLGAISVLMSNLIVNQPMTILLTRACMSPAFAAAASAAGAVAPAAVRHNLQAALFAVVVGSNTAACFTVIGSLAGIMWVAIIKQRGLRTTYVQFTRLMLPAGVASTAAALLVLWCEFVFSPY